MTDTPAAMSRASTKHPRPGVAVFVVLMALTGLTSLIAETRDARTTLTTALVLTVVAVKIHLVGTHFIELRHAPLPLRLLFHIWIVAIWTVIVVLS